MHNNTAFPRVRPKAQGMANSAAPDARQVDWQDRLVMASCFIALWVFLVMVLEGVVL